MVAGVGRRLPGPERLPGRAARDRRLEQLRPLELGAVRRGDRRGRVGHRSAGRRRRPTTGPRTIVRDEVPVVPLVYGPGWSLSRTGLLGRRPERARHRPDGRAGVGRLMRRRLLALVAAAGLCWSASCRSRLGRRLGRPSGRRRSSRRSRPGSASASRSRSAEAAARVELLLTTADALGPTVIEVSNPPASGAATLTHLLDPAEGHMLPNTPLVARWRLVSADDPTDVAARARGLGHLRRRPVPVADRGRRHRPRPLVRGSAAFGRPGAARSPRTPSRETSDLLGRDRDGADRLLHLRRRGRVLRRARPGHPRERRRAGRRRHPDAVRADPAEPDRRRVGRHRHPARADPPRVRHRRRRTRTTSRRTGSTRASRSTSARATTATDRNAVGDRGAGRHA